MQRTAVRSQLTLSNRRRAVVSRKASSEGKLLVATYESRTPNGQVKIAESDGGVRRISSYSNSKPGGSIGAYARGSFASPGYSISRPATVSTAPLSIQ